MKDEPWRGNPASRIQHLEQKIRRQKERLAWLEKEVQRLRLLNEIRPLPPDRSPSE